MRKPVIRIGCMELISFQWNMVELLSCRRCTSEGTTLVMWEVPPQCFVHVMIRCVDMTTGFTCQKTVGLGGRCCYCLFQWVEGLILGLMPSPLHTLMYQLSQGGVSVVSALTDRQSCLKIAAGNVHPAVSPAQLLSFDQRLDFNTISSQHRPHNGLSSACWRHEFCSTPASGDHRVLAVHFPTFYDVSVPLQMPYIILRNL